MEAEGSGEGPSQGRGQGAEVSREDRRRQRAGGNEEGAGRGRGQRAMRRGHVGAEGRGQGAWCLGSAWDSGQFWIPSSPQALSVEVASDVLITTLQGGSHQVPGTPGDTGYLCCQVCTLQVCLLS